MFTYQERPSASPFIERVWMTLDLSDGVHMAPADGCWDLIFVFSPLHSQAILSGPTDAPSSFRYLAGSRNIGIRFHPSTYFEPVSARPALGILQSCDINVFKQFELFGGSWRAPEYDTVEALVGCFADAGIIRQDRIVRAVLDGTGYAVTPRTAQRRFGAVTGIPPRFHMRIRRANAAMELLRARHSIADVAYATGFADQAHMTRVLKCYAGLTPAEISRTSGPGAS